MTSICFAHKLSPTFFALRAFFQTSSYMNLPRPQLLKSVIDQPAGEPAYEESSDIMDIWRKALDFVGRNSRPPKKANHGARPCSSVMRRLRKKAYYKKPNFGAMNDQEANSQKI